MEDNNEKLFGFKRESIKVLTECIDLQNQKSKDYQNPNSNIVQAMHYRRGVDTIHDMIWQKLLRAQSLLESKGDPKFESLEDTYKDLINYASFAVSYLRGKMEGQQEDRDVFNNAKD
jgi:hypothetical protein